MKLNIKTILIVTFAIVGSPASGQPYSGQPDSSTTQPGRDFRDQLNDLQRRVQDGISQHQIDSGEADRAFRELAAIRQQDQDLHASNGPLSDSDRFALQGRLDHLSRSIHWMREGASSNSRPVLRPYGRPYDSSAQALGTPYPSDQLEAGPWTVDRRIQWLSDRVDRSREDGTLTMHEAHRAAVALGDIRRLESRMNYQNGGLLSASDRDTLQHRLDTISQGMRWSRSNNERAPWES